MGDTKLPVWPTVAYAFGVFGREFGRFVALPLICMTAIDLIRPVPLSTHVILQPGLSALWGWMLTLAISLPATLVSALLVTLFALPWIRHVQTGEGLPMLDAFFRWSPVHTKFWAGVLAVDVLGGVLRALAAAVLPVAIWGTMIADLLLLLAVIRFSLVFPAVAANAIFSPAASWQWTRGNGGYLFLTGLLILVPLVLLAIAVSIGQGSMADGFMESQMFSLVATGHIVNRLIFFAGLAVLGAALCRAYDVLGGDTPQPSAPLPGSA